MITDTAVSDTLARTVDAWDANDADAFADCYAPDATVVLHGGVFLRGRDAIRAFMAETFAGPRRGTRSYDEPESVVVAGDTAAVVSRSGVLLPGEHTPPAERLRRATWTLARQDGRWLVLAYHNCVI